MTIRRYYFGCFLLLFLKLVQFTNAFVRVQFGLGTHTNGAHDDSHHQKHTTTLPATSSTSLAAVATTRTQHQQQEKNQKENIICIDDYLDPAGPSLDLLQLDVNESYTYSKEDEDNHPFNHKDGIRTIIATPTTSTFNVHRVSNDPHIFLFQNILSDEECESLIQQQNNNDSKQQEQQQQKQHDDGDDNNNNNNNVKMEEAKITEGDKDMRSNCRVGWIQNQSISTTSTTTATTNSNHTTTTTSSLPLKLGRIVGNILMTDEAKRNGWCEPLQLVHYNAKGGKFDLHYDGFYRTITVIYYLNGVGNTWFPFASSSTSATCPTSATATATATSEKSNDDTSIMSIVVPPTNRDEAVKIVKECNMKPGKHGILAAGINSIVWNEDYNKDNVIQVQKGDAIAFYNYKTLVSENNIDDGREEVEKKNDNKKIIERDWKSIHAGLPTTVEEGEKWIANHWIHHLPFQKDWEEMEKV